MKKLIKILLILVIIIGLVTGVLYYVYNYRQGKKEAEVVSVENVAMTGYWGDTIQSYGQVTSEKSQTCYLPSGTEILSVNVQEGDFVEAGQVLMTVKKESQNIKGKELEVQKAQQAYLADKNRLERLQNTKPIPEYIASSPDTRDVDTLNSKTYRLKKDGDLTGYKAGQIVYVENYSDGLVSGRTYYAYKENGDSQVLDDTRDDDSAKIDALKAEISSKGSGIFKVSEDISHSEITVGTFYYDAETGVLIGHESIGPDGEYREKYTPPEGYKPSELKEEIQMLYRSLEKKDLDLRIKENQLEQMRNTTDNGEILAKVSGTVSKLQNKDNFNNTQPFLIITATNDYHITGTIGEFYLNDVRVGDMVDISSWEKGISAQAEITAITDTPSTESFGFWTSGNSNSSNYEFKATFDKNTGIEIGDYVDITITPANQEEGGMYIYNYLVRKDSAGSFVMKKGKNNKLEKVYVKVGKNLYGEMIEIKSGITTEDYIAFPYGNGAIEGIKCKEVDDFSYGDGGLG